MVGSDLGKLFNQSRVVDVESSKFTEGLGCLLRLATLDIHAGGFRQEQHAEEEDDSPCELYGDRDAVRATVVPVFRCIVHDGCKEQADGNGELVGTNNGSSDPLGRGLGLARTSVSSDRSLIAGRVAYLVQWDHHGDHANTEPSEDTTGEE